MQNPYNKLSESPAERKKPEWTSQEYKNDFLDAALDCIVTMNQAGVITEWNKAAEKVFGYTKSFAKGVMNNSGSCPSFALSDIIS